MKPHELRQLSDDELRKRIAEEEQGLANLRFQKVLGQLEKPHRISAAHREIARMRTLLRERTITTTATTKQQ
ncbi:MAG: 50S ribosomal protein L29 [Bacteroidota bacterium]